MKAEKVKATGVYYREMIAHVRKVLEDVKRVVPDHDPKQGYELAGFVWFQGFNDYVDSGAYPERNKPGGYDSYAELLGHLIRDVRRDLSAPRMPFVIGVMGIDGVEKGEKPPMSHFRKAQAAPASVPEFKGSVAAAGTAPFWDDDLDALEQRMHALNEKLDREFKKDPKSTREGKEAAREHAVAEQFTDAERKRLKAGVSNGGYHYLGAAKIMAPIGKAFAEALLPAAPKPVPSPEDGSSKPVKVFVLAGQSNMEGFGVVEADPKRNHGKGSLAYLADDPATADRFKHLRAKDGKWAVRDDVWIHFLDRKGKLAVGYGYGADRNGRAEGEPKAGEMAGYLLVPNSKVDKAYNAGFSLYVAAWPLLKNYPGQNFPSGLFGTWMFAQFDGPAPKKHHSDIEGGLGWWRGTRFATETPKFGMGGVALEFSERANGPGAGKGRDWKRPAGKYAVAQLSPWALWPPDGLNLKPGTNGELFGYGYLPLPLTSPKTTTAGKGVPTGDHCWTQFLNTGNFKGPVTFFTPYFWSRPSAENPELGGLFLDTRPSDPNQALQKGTQHIPAYLARDAKGDAYARVAPTQFPGKPDADAALIHGITAYKKAALWDGVKAWFGGGQEAFGAIDPKASSVHTFDGKGGSSWEVHPPGAKKPNKVPLAWSSFATPVALDATTYGYKWTKELVTKADAKAGSIISPPEYYRVEKDAKDKERWVAVNPKDVPAETGLAEVAFPQVRTPKPGAYVTPDEADSCWQKPGPAAGPFEAKLGDGSVATYYWYRFADQPALLNAT